MEGQSSDYDVNVRMIAFVFVSVFLILMCIYCIRIYADKKQMIKHEMRIEADILAGDFATDLSYASYFLEIIANELQHNSTTDLHYIKNTLAAHHKTKNYNPAFGWRKYSWVNTNFEEVVTSTGGILSEPRPLPFVSAVINKNELLPKDQIFFYTSKIHYKQESLKLISAVIDRVSNNYLGYVVLSYDMETVIRKLNASKKNSYTNFIVLSDDNSVVMQSKPVIYNMIDAHRSLSSYFSNVLQKLGHIDEKMTDVSYVDMASGISYYIKKIHNLPFVLVINVDDDEIKNNILDSVIKKFIEVSIFVCVFLLVVITIYKRETYLRARAEHATIAANRATQAKTNFLAFTAHEIRSPLGFIATGSEIMIKKLFGTLNSRYYEYAVGIHQNTKIILDFITDILDESQIIEGKFKIIAEASDIIKIIENAIQINDFRAKKKDITINFSVIGSIPQPICDKRRILQVMNNLITNSIKYSKNNTSIVIKVALTDSELSIIVADQGIGMTEDEIQVALSSYGVIAKDKDHLIESYGLGLPIVKMLLEAHGATLLIKSQPQIGTVITALFPKSILSDLICEAQNSAINT